MSKVTVAQVKACWDATAEPSARKVADALTAAGTKISFRTVARYAEAGFKEAPKQGKSSVEKAEQAKAKAIERKTQIIEAGLKAAITGQIGELMQRTAYDLEQEQRKALMALNIALMREAEKVMPILILNPKETGDLLRASADVAEAMRDTRNGEKPPGNGTMIEATATDITPVDPLAEALNRFRQTSTQAA